MKKDNEVSQLDKIKERIYREQFHEEDEDDDGTVHIHSGGAKMVLGALQDLMRNPELCRYVVMCLKKQGLITGNQKFFYVVTHHEERMPYNEKIHQTPELHKKLCIDGDWGLRRSNHIVKKVFVNSDQIEGFMKTYTGDEKSGIIKFEKYSVIVIE